VPPNYDRDRLAEEIRSPSRRRSEPDPERQAEQRGVTLEREGNYAEALESVARRRSLYPRARSNSGAASPWYLCRLNRWDDAVAGLKAVLREAPADPDATKALYAALEHVQGPE